MHKLTRLLICLAVLLCAAGVSAAADGKLMHCFYFTAVEGATDADWQAFYKATDELPGKSNYFRGNDPYERWPARAQRRRAAARPRRNTEAIPDSTAPSVRSTVRVNLTRTRWRPAGSEIIICPLSSRDSAAATAPSTSTCQAG